MIAATSLNTCLYNIHVLISIIQQFILLYFFVRPLYHSIYARLADWSENRGETS